MPCRQDGYFNRRKDDNYIALRDTETGEYIINGGFVVSMFSKSVQVLLARYAVTILFKLTQSLR